MRQKRSNAYPSHSARPRSSRILTVAELAMRMSELLQLRDKVERAERGIRQAGSGSKSRREISAPPHR
jgi:hypothetical protein